MFWRKNQKKRLDDVKKKYLDPKIAILEADNGRKVKVIEFPHGNFKIVGPVDVDGNEMPYDNYDKDKEQKELERKLDPNRNHIECKSCLWWNKIPTTSNIHNEHFKCENCDKLIRFEDYTTLTSDGTPVSDKSDKKFRED